MKKQKGFSLTEVLVTLVLVTTGVLGMVAMQSRSILYTQESIQRNAAVDLTKQLVEILRANPTLIFKSYPPAYPTYAGLEGNSLFFKAKGSAFSPALATLSAGSCTAPANPQQQRDCWVEQVNSTLPGAADLMNAQMYICQSSEPTVTSTPKCDAKGSIIEIQLAWTVKEGSCPDDRAPNSSTCIYRTRIEL